MPMKLLLKNKYVSFPTVLASQVFNNFFAYFLKYFRLIYDPRDGSMFYTVSNSYISVFGYVGQGPANGLANVPRGGRCNR